MKLTFQIPGLSKIQTTAEKSSQAQQLLSYIKSARSEMEQAACLFNELTDTAAVDYASYSFLAAKTKYEYLMKEAKDQGLSL
ncbi:DUF2508 family protein [Ihubacter sp. rT4E-8]|uniref:DUF2508 family protein n=1 Tax=unclassified Ihubacter TaxID=2633299 RepID=UPI00137A21FC